MKNKVTNGKTSENNLEIGGRNKQANTDLQTSDCKSKAFVAVEGTSEFSDYQEIKMQELFKTLEPGLIPRSMCIIL